MLKISWNWAIPNRLKLKSSEQMWDVMGFFWGPPVWVLASLRLREACRTLLFQDGTPCLYFFTFWLHHVPRRFPDQRSNQGPQQWKQAVLTIGLPGSSQHRVPISLISWEQKNTSIILVVTFFSLVLVIVTFIWEYHFLDSYVEKRFHLFIFYWNILLFFGIWQ